MGHSDEEAQPLMGKTVAFGVQAEPAKMRELRSWRFPLLHICGDFSAEDVTAGCLAWHSPLIAFGWNMRRSLQLSFWREILKAVLFLGGVYLVLNLAAHGLVFSCMPEPSDDDATDDPMRRLLHKHHTEGGPEDGPKGGPHDNGPHHPCARDFINSLPPACRTRVIGGLALISLVAIAVFGFAVVYAARRRQQMRVQYGIAGTFRGDVFSWMFCAFCALAQETRTLMMNQVHDGVWYGPVPGAIVCGAVDGVPAAQEMV